ncbi:MAG: hypothetical protein PHW72_02120 [Candidatus Pacebacteria bacterium]|nr:hypothetical protein [Candidatus Paceibacterota bacterium]
MALILSNGKTNWEYLCIAAVTGVFGFFFIFNQWENFSAFSNLQNLKKNNELTIRPAALPKEEPLKTVANYCRQRGSSYYHVKALYIKFDADPEKEIVGICQKGQIERKALLFVLDYQNGEYVAILEKEGELGMNYNTFQNLMVKNVNEDAANEKGLMVDVGNIEEILYRASDWSGQETNSYSYLYSPESGEWYWRHDWLKTDLKNGRKEEGRDFSDNIDRGGLFKVYLENFF